MTFQPKAYALQQLSDVKSRYLQDLAVLPDAALDVSPGGAARSALHFTFEIICVNQRLAKRVRGEDPGPFNPELWKVTPDEYRSRAAATAGFANSMDEMIAAIEAVPEDEMFRPIQTPGGQTSPFDLGLFCATHINYHDGQLNYLQAIHGDADIHWAD